MASISERDVLLLSFAFANKFPKKYEWMERYFPKGESEMYSLKYMEKNFFFVSYFLYFQDLIKFEDKAGRPTKLSADKKDSRGFRKLRQHFVNHCGIDISLGTVFNLVNKTKKLLEKFEEFTSNKNLKGLAELKLGKWKV